MPNGYSNDLRDRVLAYYEDNHTQLETCAVFGISRSTLNSWVKLKRETGSAHLRPRPTTRQTRKITSEALHAYLAKHPDAYLREIGEALGVSDVAILYACRRYGITRKKRRHAIENGTKRSVKRFSKA